MVLIVRLSSDKGSFFLLGEFMRYHYEKLPIYLKMYGKRSFSAIQFILDVPCILCEAKDWL